MFHFGQIPIYPPLDPIEMALSWLYKKAGKGHDMDSYVKSCQRDNPLGGANHGLDIRDGLGVP
eukprot:scaffold5475_cov164-Skeletonema_dohrnii-CCMP3373.AAC.5